MNAPNPGRFHMRASPVAQGINIKAPSQPRSSAILSADALAFLSDLHRKFEPTRRALLEARKARYARIASGEKLDFRSDTKHIREGAWKVAAPPEDLKDRRVEITGPTERKMVINALNSGAKVFMADFEDANVPTWANLIEGQQNLIDAIERRIDFTSPEGKEYKLNAKTATLVVRPRGWHLEEKHLKIDAAPISGSLFDAGLYLFHNAKRLLKRGSGPYFYLPKMESHEEARLWADVFRHAETTLQLPHGSIRATVLIETIPAAFEMEEILYELRDHSCALNAGRWDYLFSVIKKFRERPDLRQPDRSQLTMTVPFMRAYTQLLVKTCHARGAHAIGGMAAFIPNRKDVEVTEKALARVREDKLREAGDGCDGTWVAHPDLVPVAMEIFDQALGKKPNQVDKQRPDVKVTADQLTDFRVQDGKITEEGVRNNISAALLYLESWLRGTGAVAINNLMEDAATAEISRSQLWLWIHRNEALPDGRAINPQRVSRFADEELVKIQKLLGEERFNSGRFKDARRLLERVALGKEFPEFLTIPAYEMIE